MGLDRRIVDNDEDYLDISNDGRVRIDSYRTAFGESAVAEKSPIMQGSFEYTVDNTELNSKVETSGGTVTQSNAMCVVSSSTTANSDAQFKTTTHAKYRAGQGGNVRFTALFSDGAQGCYQYIGLADERGSSASLKNGYMIGYDGTTFGFHRFVNDVKVTVSQADWEDPLDGSGRSGMLLDNTKLNVWEIKFQYLGAGEIILSVEDDSTGKFIEVHRVLYANKNTEPSVHNPNFHFMIDVDNGATTNNVLVQSASYAYFIEGKNSFIELHQPQFGSGEKQKTTVTTEVAILTIRNKATYVSKTNFIGIILVNISSSIEASSANNLGKVRVVKNTTLGGTPSYSDINTNNSVVEIDTAGTTLTGGIEILTIPLAGKNDKSILSLIEQKIVLEPGDSLTIAGSSANSATINAGCFWRELF